MLKLFGLGKREKPEPLNMISVHDLKRMLDRGEDVVVVDVRQPSAYTEYPGVIPGSIRIPPAELPERYGELPRDRLIVPY